MSDIPDDLGPTGEFPEGKMRPDDEGELKLAVGRSNDKVVILFGKPIAWLGMTARDAFNLADKIRQQAFKCRGK